MALLFGSVESRCPAPATRTCNPASANNAGRCLPEIPVGTILAWHKSLSGTPALPAGWAECNGQTIDDAESPYSGVVVPNLNGDPSGASSPGLGSKERLFLRGGLTSGSGESDLFASHSHGYESESNSTGWGGTNSGFTQVTETRDWKSTEATVGSETRPKNMGVVWIIRIK